MEPLVSVIVPVYNVEKYLEKCINSIINQTLKEIEIILIDDGSTDNCPRIIDEYAKRDKRVIAVHKENGGQGSARNAGLDIASGEYIGFVDSDDWIDLNMYEELYKDIIKNNSDISICGRRVVDENNKLKGEVKLINEVINLNEFGLDKYITSKLLSPHTVVVYNRLYRRCIIERNDIRFKSVDEVGSEDALFNYCILFNTKIISSIDKVFYNGLERSGSTARTYKFGSMNKTANLMECMKSYSEKVNKQEVWNKVEPILFQFYQQWNINLIKKYSNEDITKIISKELEVANKSKVFKQCQKRLALGINHEKNLKKCGYKFSGRVYIRLFMFLSYINQYNLAARLRTYR